MQKNTEDTGKGIKGDSSHLEDLAMTAAAQYWGEELLRYVGVREKPVRPAPTVQVHLEAHKLYEDFNFEMQDKSWFHFEFESDGITREDLRRFREYEAATGRVYGVDVVTCVVCSAPNKQMISGLKTGINTYKVRIISLKKESADKVFRKIKERKKRKRKDFIPVLLSPLMGGNMSVKDRITAGFKLIREEGQELEKEEAGKWRQFCIHLPTNF